MFGFLQALVKLYGKSHEISKEHFWSTILAVYMFSNHVILLPLIITLMYILPRNGCDVFEPNGEVKPTLTLYPLKHLSTLLAQNGCSIAMPHHPHTV